VAPLAAEDPLLLHLELGISKYSLRLELAELLELRQLGGHVWLRRWLRRRGGRLVNHNRLLWCRLLILLRWWLLVLGLLFVCLLLLLVSPAAGLPARDTVRDSGRGTRNDGRAGYAANKAWHV
jgi:hypothetical protein